MMSQSVRDKLFTWEEIQSHGYYVAHDKVYDPQYISGRHPGGQKCIERCLGEDCTTHYNMHGAAGRKSWAAAHIGYLNKGNTQPALSDKLGKLGKSIISYMGLGPN